MTNLQFGMPTLLETESAEDCAALCRSLGLHFIELNMNLPQYQAESIDVRYFADLADRYGIYFTAHLDENLNVCDFNPKVAAAYSETVVQAIGLAEALRMPVLNMHLSPGVYFTLPTEKVYLFSKYEKLFLRRLHDFRDRCEQAIGGESVKICVENADGYERDFVRKGLGLLLESPLFALTFDVGHNASAGGVHEPFIREHLDRLCHLHLHDAVGGSNHLPLGAGTLRLQEYLELADRHSCRVVLETKTVGALRESLSWLKNRGYL